MGVGLDEEVFLTHLGCLGIETEGVSFSWLLEEENHILEWFHNNIHNNTILHPQDGRLFADLLDSGNVLNEADLKRELDKIVNTYEGIVTPCDTDSQIALEETRRKVEDLDEWLKLLEDQELSRKEYTEKNEEIGRQLSKEKFDLTESLSVETAMLARLTEECQDLLITSRNERLKCYNLVEEVLNICTESKNSEDKLFFSQMPLEDYYTKTDLLATYIRHNMATQMNFFSDNEDPTQMETKCILETINSDWKSAESKLMDICDKLREGVWRYIGSKAELAGTTEQLKYIDNYDISSCFDSCFEKVKYAGLVKVLEKDLEVLKSQRVPEDIHKFVDGQSERLVLGEMQLRCDKTRYMYNKLCSLMDLSATAVHNSHIGVMCVKRDQITVENIYNFSLDFLNCLQGYIQSNKAREMVIRPPAPPCFLLQTLSSLLECDVTCGVDMCMAKLERLQAETQRLEMEVFYAKFDAIRDEIEKGESRAAPLKKLIWDGPTDQPNILNQNLDLALFEVRRANTLAEEDINKIAKIYMEFKKTIDQDSVLYNLWKWFLADVNQIKLFKNKYMSRENKPIKPFKS